jgi:hypothetical protein
MKASLFRFRLLMGALLLAAGMAELLSTPAGAAVHKVDFAKEGTESLFEGAATIPEVGDFAKGGKGMILPARLSSVESRPLPIAGGTKYRLQLKASLVDDFVVEKNPRVHILTLLSNGHQETSRVAVLFQDAEGKEMPGLGMIPPEVFFLTEQPQLYTTVFHAPKEAASMKLRFIPNRRLTQVSSMALEPETEEQSVNPNPDFRYGELSYSGWKPGRDGRLYMRPDGKVVLAAGYGGRSPFFPLNPGTRYDVHVKGSGGTINLVYFDRAGKQMASRFLIRPAPDGAKTDFTPPEGVTACRLEFYGNAILEELRVTEN